MKADIAGINVTKNKDHVTIVDLDVAAEKVGMTLAMAVMDKLGLKDITLAQVCSTGESMIKIKHKNIKRINIMQVITSKLNSI